MRIEKQKIKIDQVANTMNVNLNTLDTLCKYIITDPDILRLNYVVALKNFINGLDMSQYENDIEKMQRITFIKRGIDARLNYNLTDRNLVISHILTGLNFRPNFIDISKDLTIDNLEWIKNMIQQTTKYGFMDYYTDQFLSICTEFKTTNYDMRGDVVERFESLLDRVKNEFRKANVDSSLLDMEFSLKAGKFEEQISEIYKVVTNPSRRLRCGMQGLNEMLGGGFEAGRTYIYLGITGVGKSITLLNLAYQIKKYNPEYQLKDKTKTPCVVYLTMENTVVETITRLFDMVTESQYGMGNYSLDEVINKLKTEGQLMVNDNSPIDIIIKFKPNRSVDTSYLYTLVDDLNDQGYEPICMIQDHLLRIRSAFGSHNSEPRFELGDIVNEFKSFAAAKDIPLITNFHLNREAMKEVERYANRATNIDVTQKLGKSNVSESVMILNNIDCAIVINKEYDNEGNAYMGFHIIKMRDKTSLTYFAQPFAFGSGIRLIEDINGPAMYNVSIHGNSDLGDGRITNVRTSSTNVMSNISNITSRVSSNETTFMDSNRYTSLDELNSLPDYNPFEDSPEVAKLPIVKPFTYIKKPDTINELDSLKEELNKLKIS